MPKDKIIMTISEVAAQVAARAPAFSSLDPIATSAYLDNEL